MDPADPAIVVEELLGSREIPGMSRNAQQLDLHCELE
jgi:hypothetical protein